MYILDLSRSKTFDYVESLPTSEVPLASFKSIFEAKVNKILNFLQLLLSAFCLRFSVIHYCWNDTLQKAKMFLIPHVELFLISAKILFQCVPVNNFLLPPPHHHSVPETMENWAFYVRYILWILVLALLFILWNLNQNIVWGRFCTRRNNISLFLFLLKHNLKGT